MPRAAPRPDPLAVLTREHEKLLAQVASKRAELGRLEENTRRVMSEARSKLEPMIAKVRKLTAQVHGMFGELLKPGRLSKRARKGTQEIYRELMDEGFLPPPEFAQPPPGADEDDAPPPEHAGGFTANKPQAASLRELYRRMAAEHHPDRVQDEDEKARRTETMKEITVAYSQGDLARLLELERVLKQPAVVASAALRIAALKKTNLELRRQLRELQHALRDERAAPTRGGARGLVAEAKEDHDALVEIRDFVRAFRDGKIDLDEFLAGPFGDAQAMIAEMMMAAFTAAGRRPSGRAASRRSGR